MSKARLILDNGGGATLQLGAWAHYYEDAARAAEEIRQWFEGGDTDGWEGHEPEALACYPSPDEIRNGGYRVIAIDRDHKSVAGFAQYLNEYSDWGNARAIADALAGVL